MAVLLNSTELHPIDYIFIYIFNIQKGNTITLSPHVYVRSYTKLCSHRSNILTTMTLINFIDIKKTHAK